MRNSDELSSPLEIESATADTDVPMNFLQMAQALREIGRAIPDEDADLEIDLDDYPLY